MNVIRTLLCGGAMVALAYSVAPAADDPDGLVQVQRKEIQDRLQQLQGRFGGGGPLISDKGLEKLDLSKDQKEKYDKINAEYQDKQKDTQTKLRDAIQAKDAEKIKEAVQGLRTGFGKLRGEYLDKVEPILTDAQKKIFADIRKESGRGGFNFDIPRIRGGGAGAAGAAPGQILPRGVQEKLKLSDEQKKRLDDIQKDVDGKIRDLLTEEQRKMLEDLKQGAPRERRQLQLRQNRNP